MTDLTTLIQHPELLNKETLYDLRSVIALHPYYQPARFLLLRNLYLLHDSSFDDELRRAALYVTDRTVLFELIEGAHYRLRESRSKSVQPETERPEPRLERPKEQEEVAAPAVSILPKAEEQPEKDEPAEPSTPSVTIEPAKAQPSSRTATLIDSFLDSLPKEEPKNEKRKPTPADATIDYVAYLLETEDAEDQTEESSEAAIATPSSRTSALIDTFINEENGRMTLQEETEYEPEEETQANGENEASEDFFTETLAQIYIKQGRYSKALEIIRRLNLIYPKKNRYFADQIRFLEKLIQNGSK